MTFHVKLKKLGEIDTTFLENIYIKSEYIDPIDEIIDRLGNDDEGLRSQPFVVMDVDQIVAFFTIESVNPHVEKPQGVDSVYWLESFFITKRYLGKGYSESVLNEILEVLPLHLPSMSVLKLTVNVRNEIAQYLYKKCGFTDTDEKYLGGPAGPQHIYEMRIH